MDQDELLARAVREEDWTTAAILGERGHSTNNFEDENIKKKLLHHAANMWESNR